MGDSEQGMTIAEHQLYDAYQALLFNAAFRALEETIGQVAKDFDSTSYLHSHGKTLDYAAGVLEGVRLFLGMRSTIEQALAVRDEGQQ